MAVELWLKGLPLQGDSGNVYRLQVNVLSTYAGTVKTIVYQSVVYLLSAVVVGLWLYKATCSKYRMSQIPGTSDTGAVLAS